MGDQEESCGQGEAEPRELQADQEGWVLALVLPCAH